MHIEALRNYCIAKPGTTEEFPFGEETLVFKVLGKMYALAPLERDNRVSLKCDPEYAIELREQHPEAIQAAWHMNKKHWNQVSLVEGLAEELIVSLIDHSYELVVSKLKKAEREALQNQ
jgi:predicted DNA-binding protein (MmcQ/YjbR family)